MPCRFGPGLLMFAGRHNFLPRRETQMKLRWPAKWPHRDAGLALTRSFIRRFSSTPAYPLGVARPQNTLLGAGAGSLSDRGACFLVNAAVPCWRGPRFGMMHSKSA